MTLPHVKHRTGIIMMMNVLRVCVECLFLLMRGGRGRTNKRADLATVGSSVERIFGRCGDHAVEENG